MAKLLLETLAGEYDPDEFEDDYAEAVHALVEAKLAGGEVKRTKEAAPSAGEVVDLLAALQKSVAAAKSARGEDAAVPEPAAAAEPEPVGEEPAPAAEKPARRSTKKAAASGGDGEAPKSPKKKAPATKSPGKTAAKSGKSTAAKPKKDTTEEPAAKSA